MEYDGLTEGELTEFQKAVLAYRKAGYSDHHAVLDFLDARDKLLIG